MSAISITPPTMEPISVLPCPGAPISIVPVPVEEIEIEGAPGIPGPSGEKGEQGEKGEPGEKGDPGGVGDKGPTGDKGPVGDQGPVGPQGEQGPVGERGPIGPTGATGDKGPAGDKGPVGDKGPTGDQGAPGVSGVFWGFVSGEYSVIFADQSHAIPHGLGAIPTLVQLVLRCKVADFGYEPGDEIHMASHEASGVGIVTVSANAANIYIASTGAIRPSLRTTGAYAGTINPACWRWVVRASVL